jgi:RNA polymerase sigma-70 factor, ECF subfamily
MGGSFREVIGNLSRGDNEAFNLLYRTYYKRLYNFACSYLKDDFVAGNIVQDTFLALWENREKIEPETNLPAYLLTIVRNKALNHFHRLTIKAKVEENVKSQASRELELRCATLEACNPEEMFHSDVENIIRKTLETLPEQCRKVITLSRFDGLSNKEIAAKLTISVKTVEFHITRGLKSLRENLKDYLLLLLLIFKWM